MKQPKARKIRLLLVDDHEVVRIGLKTVFEQADGIDVVGEAGTAADAISECNRLHPEVVLMDLRLAGGSGLDACREILSADPTVRVLFLTSYSDAEAVKATILAGAAGYLLKEIAHRALIDAIKGVAEGKSILDPKVTQSVLSQITQLSVKGSPDGKESLSSQERRVLAEVVNGKTNKEIAVALRLSERTVKNYLSNAFQKLGVNRRSHAAVIFNDLQKKPALD
ncbi:MAG: response regulator [Burkholderiales bacterium]